MSILSDAFDAVVDFFTPAVNAVVDNKPVGKNSSYGYGDLASDALAVLGPAITTAVTRPKPLPLPKRPEFPEIPDSIKDDPRMQQLLGGYGFPNNFPSIEQQEIPRQSDFAIAFPAIFSAGQAIFAREISGTGAAQRAIQTQQQKIDVAKGTPSVLPINTTQVVDATVMQADPTGALDYTKYQNLGPDAIKTTSKFDPMIIEAAKKYDLDPNILRAVIHTESSGDPNAVGDNGEAIGLGQLHRSAAIDAGGRVYSKEELKDPLTNIDLTAAYLKKLHNNFGGAKADADYSKTVTAYNRGETAVKQYGAFNSPKGREYRGKVMGAYTSLTKLTGNI